jgi:hypothetical protein
VRSGFRIGKSLKWQGGIGIVCDRQNKSSKNLKGQKSLMEL